MTENAVEPTEMELRVARAIAIEDGLDPDVFLPLGLARAAIRAMQPMTDDMRTKFSEYTGDEPTGCGDLPYAWAFLINAASPPD